MANFYEKIIVLSRLSSGELPTAFLRKRSGRLEITLEIEQSFDYIIVTNGKEVQREEGKFSAPNFEFDGVFACGVYSGGKLISYGSVGKLSKAQFLALADNCTYDDWQIATENYYKGSIYDKADDDAETDFGKEKSRQSESSHNNPYQNDESGATAKKQEDTYSGSKTVEHTQSTGAFETSYYDKVRCRIENIMDGGKKYLPLSSLVPFSRFIELSENGKRYYLGIQGKNRNCPDYIIYAVKGNLDSPPDGFSDAFFTADNLFSPKTSGYFLLLTSCKTGETAKRVK